jgi:hypothetical protein
MSEENVVFWTINSATELKLLKKEEQDDDAKMGFQPR